MCTVQSLRFMYRVHGCTSISNDNIQIFNRQTPRCSVEIIRSNANPRRCHLYVLYVVCISTCIYLSLFPTWTTDNIYCTHNDGIEKFSQVLFIYASRCCWCFYTAYTCSYLFFSPSICLSWFMWAWVQVASPTDSNELPKGYYSRFSVFTYVYVCISIYVSPFYRFMFTFCAKSLCERKAISLRRKKNTC